MARFKALSQLVLVLTMLALPRAASAQRELLTATGAKGTLAIDQVSGFRVGATPQGPSVTYYGPIGLAIQSYSEAVPLVPNGNDVFHTTSIWLAPSADIFVINHLSVGGLLEIISTSGSTDTPDPRNPAISDKANLPTLTSITVLPRVGYLIALGDRWGIWPRAGLGYASRQSSNPDGSTDTFQGLIVDVDCGFLFRFNETFFGRVAPEIGWLPSGSHTNQPVGAGPSVSADASFIQFTLTGGIGIFFGL